MSGSEHFRSAAPLAAAGIACLGLVPTFGGPERPLHWAISAGMVGFGALLWTRHRLSHREGALAEVSAANAAQASRHLLLITAASAAICCAIIASRLAAGKPIAVLSASMPAAGLGWLTWLGLKMRRAGLTVAEEPSALTDRPSRRPPPRRDSPTPPRPSQGDTTPNRHVNA